MLHCSIYLRRCGRFNPGAIQYYSWLTGGMEEVMASRDDLTVDNSDAVGIAKTLLMYVCYLYNDFCLNIRICLVVCYAIRYMGEEHLDNFVPH